VLFQQQLLLKELIFIFLKNTLDMKKTLSIITVSVLVWGCSHKITPAAGAGTGASNSGTTATAPAATANFTGR